MTALIDHIYFDNPRLKCDLISCDKLEMNSFILLIEDMINSKRVLLINRKKLLILAYVIKTRKLDPFSAMNMLNIKIKEIFFLKEYYYTVHGKIRLDKTLINQHDIIMLVGLSSSGKSTFCNDLLLAYGDSILHLNQDEIGKEQCLDLITTKNKIILLDRCNLTLDGRKEFLDLCHKKNILCINFDYDKETCKERLENRKYHNMTDKDIIDSMFEKYEIPIINEGFNKIIKIQNNQDLKVTYQYFGLKNTGIRKFGRTKHIINLGSATRDDLIFNSKEVNQLLSENITIEEKIDGANVGIFLEDGNIVFQNRSHYITNNQEQFETIDKWKKDHIFELMDILMKDNLILYGEWVYMKHSISYTNLPDYFILFDIYDRDLDCFLSRSKIEEIIEGTTIKMIHRIAEGKFSLEEIKNLTYSDSHYYDGIVEGIYVRSFENETVKYRGKIVRASFSDEITTHWTHNKKTINSISYNV